MPDPCFGKPIELTGRTMAPMNDAPISDPWTLSVVCPCCNSTIVGGSESIVKSITHNPQPDDMSERIALVEEVNMLRERNDTLLDIIRELRDRVKGMQG